MAIVGFPYKLRVAPARHLPDALGLLVVRLIDHGALHVPGQLIEIDAHPAFLRGVELAKHPAIFIPPDRLRAISAFNLNSIDGLAIAFELQNVGNLILAHLLADRPFHLTGKILEAQPLTSAAVAISVLDAACIDAV